MSGTPAPDGMRVLVDAYWWFEGPPSNRMVQRELVRAWRAAHPQDVLVPVVPAAALARAGADPELAGALPARGRPHAVAVELEYGRLARRAGADALLTHNFAPRGGAAPRTTVFCHDVLFQDHPEWFTRAERCYLSLVGPGLVRAGAVVTSSTHEAAHVRRLNPRVPGVTPIGLAPDPALLTAAPRRPAALPAVEGFWLSVGRLNVRKNLATTVVGALRSGRVAPRRPLVVVGESDGRGPGLPDEVGAAVRAGAVVLLGGVATDELAWLYRHAELFVFLSLAEGYGLPPVEALALGCPVVVSDLAVFRETLGGRALRVPPDDVGAVAAALRAWQPPGHPAPWVPPGWDGPAREVREAVRRTAAGAGSAAARRGG
ncbi:glycosyltransferase family 4 protein [Cellulomonas sp. zg-ZUI222]|uniref:Glycosyltransferase family 4 protein n=1 Tax=Cellulomonas wangleii TaxID=2816956 RepID=A0ABX8D8P5_9CELL|nr:MULTISPECIES: glycosyltransferase family 1 protein [Cellulomonas]MBO0901679.1 glycosyltransferase family 4 protein [Cellulomonas sp. zg-ZUI22]MBO0922202.1 glycosyltransferase family 4 protein [Cellulomonas wangleii]MBO0925897.1 glycosyltransferase family 4 protein [Cellulomonas wangleii]QVI63205.1 glycosyltransferase family 4 protein [Cellulomonas wangleii]